MRLMKDDPEPATTESWNAACPSARKNRLMQRKSSGWNTCHKDSHSRSLSSSGTAASRQVCCPETEKTQCLVTLTALHCPGGQGPQHIYLAGPDLHRKEPALCQDQWLVVTELSQQQLPLAPPSVVQEMSSPGIDTCLLSLSQPLLFPSC